MFFKKKKENAEKDSLVAQMKAMEAQVASELVDRKATLLLSYKEKFGDVIDFIVMQTALWEDEQWKSKAELSDKASAVRRMILGDEGEESPFGCHAKAVGMLMSVVLDEELGIGRRVKHYKGAAVVPVKDCNHNYRTGYPFVCMDQKRRVFIRQVAEPGCAMTDFAKLLRPATKEEIEKFIIGVIENGNTESEDFLLSLA